MAIGTSAGENNQVINNASGGVALGTSTLCDNSESICLGLGCADSNGIGFYVSRVRQITTGSGNAITNLDLLQTSTDFELIYWP